MQVKDMDVLCWGEEKDLNRPCVDCGMYTGRFCDYCLAETRIPTEAWVPNHHTPLCSKCDWKYGECHFCRRQSWVTRPPWRPEPEEEPVRRDTAKPTTRR